MRNYTNRELSWLDFNRRVLMEAKNPSAPLFERVRFASIVSSNLDEFFRVRVGKLQRRAEDGKNKKDASGWKPSRLIDEILSRVHTQIGEQQAILRDELLPALAEEGFRYADVDALTPEERILAERCFEEQILPGRDDLLLLWGADALQDAENGVPHVLLMLPQGDCAAIPLPADWKPYFHLTAERGTVCVPAEAMLRAFAGRIWPELQPEGSAVFRVTRDATFSVDDKSRSRLLKSIAKGLSRQQSGRILRVEYRPGESGIPWAELFGLEEAQCYACPAVLSMKGLTAALGDENRPELNWTPFTPRIGFAEKGKIFKQIREHDCFLYHPYDDFSPVIRFLEEAAEDPKVVAIKQTLYRISRDSPVAHALVRAAQNGKQVTVLLEAKARFDEENNISWGKRLEDAGCLVIYGVPGVKIHSKIILVIRRENGKNSFYCHLGTGNYNEKTARIYTDMGILTNSRDIGQDAAGYFSLVEGYKEIRGMKRLVAAPQSMRKELMRLIDREAQAARKGKEAAIEAKMNALVDEEIIAALYRASQAGVRIDLTVRGACCLQPGIPGVSEHITVRSIVGRFLEHARVFRFCQGGKWITYLSSADWMPRNLDRRMELMFPVTDQSIRDTLAGILRLQQQDNTQAWYLKGTEWAAERCTPHETDVNAQNALIPTEEEQKEEAEAADA